MESQQKRLVLLYFYTKQWWKRCLIYDECKSQPFLHILSSMHQFHCGNNKEKIKCQKKCLNNLKEPLIDNRRNAFSERNKLTYVAMVGFQFYICICMSYPSLLECIKGDGRDDKLYIWLCICASIVMLCYCYNVIVVMVVAIKLENVQKYLSMPSSSMHPGNILHKTNSQQGRNGQRRLS